MEGTGLQWAGSCLFVLWPWALRMEDLPQRNVEPFESPGIISEEAAFEGGFCLGVPHMNLQGSACLRLFFWQACSFEDEFDLAGCCSVPAYTPSQGGSCDSATIGPDNCQQGKLLVVQYCHDSWLTACIGVWEHLLFSRLWVNASRTEMIIPCVYSESLAGNPEL